MMSVWGSDGDRNRSVMVSMMVFFLMEIVLGTLMSTMMGPYSAMLGGYSLLCTQSLQVLLRGPYEVSVP